MKPALALSFVWLVSMLLGCVRVYYPIVAVSTTPLESKLQLSDKRYLVLANQPAAGHALEMWLQGNGATVVERGALQQILTEQKIQLTHSSENDADRLRIGKLTGANRVLFVDVQIQPTSKAHFENIAVASPAISPLRISMRSVSVETGEIRWSGIGYYNSPTEKERPYLPIEYSSVYLAQLVIDGALCPKGAGYQWVHPSKGKPSGCIRK